MAWVVKGMWKIAGVVKGIANPFSLLEQRLHVAV